MNDEFKWRVRNMNTLFLDAAYSGEIKLCQETIQYLQEKKYTKVGLYASVQFVSKLNLIKEQLQQANIQCITSKPDRAHTISQILGCDNFKESLNLQEEVDAFLYIGDGRFHPLALVLGQDKDVICNDPIGNKMSILTRKDIESRQKKYKSSIIKFVSSDIIGVIVTIKPGQEQLKAGYLLEEKYPDKKFFYFIDNNISFDQLENFPFINVWVNTACPRIGFDDHEKFQHGVLNLHDALRANELLRNLC